MTSKQTNHLQRIINKANLKIISRLLLVAIAYHLLLSPTAALALAEAANNSADNQALQADLINNTQIELESPKIIEKLIAVPMGVKTISAYNVGDPNQCDDSPCTAANGENICLALELGYKRCAANFVPFGTILEIEGYGRCLVTDRMNSRYSNHIDIAMKKTEKSEALKFGRQKLNIKIIKKTTEI